MDRRVKDGLRAGASAVAVATSATAAATVHKLTEDFQATLNTPDIRSKLMQSGFEVMATDGPALDRWVRQEYERLGRFVRDNKIQLED